MPGHQDSGAPTFFGGGSCYCSAQSYTLSMFCVVHKDRKRKFIFLKQIFEIKSKSLFRHGRASRSQWSKNGAPEFWCPLMLNKIFCFYLKRGFRNENNIFFQVCPLSTCSAQNLVYDKGHQNSGAPYHLDCFSEANKRGGKYKEKDIQVSSVLCASKKWHDFLCLTIDIISMASKTTPMTRPRTFKCSKC